MNERCETMIQIPLSEYMDLRRAAEINTWIMQEYGELRSKLGYIEERLYLLEEEQRKKGN